MKELNDFKGKEILALAAVFSGKFSIDWIQDMTGARASTILSILNHGVRKGWLVCESDSFYHFTDEKIKSRCWQLNSSGETTRLHQRAADIIARELPLEETLQDELIGHLLHIENDEEGCRQLLRAGNNARKTYRVDEAKKLYRKILMDLSKRSGELADRLYSETAIQYSKIAPPASGTEKILDTINEAIKRAKRSHLTSNLALLRMHLAKQEWLRSNFKKAFRQFNLGWELAQQIDNPDFLHAVNIFGVFFRYWQGRFKDVVADYERFAPAVSELPKTEFSLLANLTIGDCLGNTGRIHQGIGMMDVIRRHCGEIGNLNISSQANAVLATFLVDLKRFDEAMDFYKEAMQLAVEGHNSFIQVLAHLGMAYIYHRTGKRSPSLKELRKYLILRDQHQIFAAPFPLLLEICFDLEADGKPPLSGITLEEEIQRSLKSENVYLKGMAVFFQALQKKRNGHSNSTIIRTIEKAISLLEQSGHFISLENCRLGLARFLIKAGKKKQGTELATISVRRLFAVERKLVPEDFLHLIQKHDAEKELLKEILTLGQELAVIKDPRDLVNRIISTVNKIIGAERGAIFLVEPAGDEIQLKAAKNISNSDIQADTFSESMKLIRKTVKTRQEQIKHFNTTHDHAIQKNNIRSIICIPMIIRNKVTGVLYADFRINRISAQSPDLETLKYFAAQAAIMMDNVQSYQALQEQFQKEREEKKYLEEQFQQEFHFEEIVGRSAAIKTVFANIDSVAATDSAVLILGETGVGKELVARAIHRNSNRCNGPFIKVNSSALSDYLVSSELFGHEKGAFTGAIEQKIGKFELADGGTLFLDEIGDITQTVQLQLLRVLQTKEFERVGGHRTETSDFRLMAATNKDLQQEIKDGRFRLDLYYRLNVFPIEVPPLKKRKDDIPLLARHFLSIYTKKLKRQIDAIPSQVLDQMIQYHWPGNVRELENYIERGTILSHKNRFVAPPIDTQKQTASKESPPVSHQDNERLHIIKTLEATHGKISGKGGAAAILNLHPNTLRYRMQKLQIRMDRRPKD